MISTVLGVLFGVIAAIHQYSLYDYVLSFLSLFGLSIPVFFFALVALLLFVAHWELFPAYGMTSLTQGFSLRDNLYHLVLPASVLSIESMAGQTRYARTAMLEVLEAGLREDRAGEGTVGAPGRREACLPQRASASDHRDDAAAARSDRGRHHHREHLRLAGEWDGSPSTQSTNGTMRC